MTSSNGSIEQTLKERGGRYGDFSSHARISQNLIRVMHETPNWERMDDDMRESLHIIANKIGRILNGDPWYGDSWHDIAGYAELVSARLENRPMPDKDELNKQIQMVWGTPADVIDDE